jgi:predicted nucleic acid-binding protein
MSEKLKLYFDSSVVSYLQAEDTPEKMADTLLFWEDVKADMYEIFISETTIFEINRCDEPKRSFMHDELDKVKTNFIFPFEEIKTLAQEILYKGILRPRCVNDSMHIASALFGKCDVIVSWNFGDLVNLRTINGVRTISLDKGYKNIDIVCPSSLLRRVP